MWKEEIMNIVELTELQFRNYSNIHSRKNYKQSVEYATLEETRNYSKLYLGLIDDNENVYAATMILEKKLNNKLKYGYVPNGYLIDFNNIELLRIFTDKLKIYLKKLNYTHLRITPLLNYQIFSSQFILKENNSSIINMFKSLGYTYISNTSRHKMVLHSNNIESTYRNFNRSLRRNIDDCLKKGIAIYQGGKDDIENFLNLTDNKSYYRDMINIFNNPNNMFEFYFAKLEPETYVNNYRYLLKREQINNEKLNQKLRNPNVKKSNNLLSRKMTSDTLITKYSNEIINGTNIYKIYPQGLILACVGIIDNRKEIIFINEGFDNNFKNIRSVSMIKWEIIKKYISRGYNTFDLGDVSISQNYTTEYGYNGNIVEYSNTFDLVINDMMYKLNNMMKKK